MVKSQKLRFVACLAVAFLLVLQVAPAEAATNYRTRWQITNDFLALEAAYPTLISHEVIGYSVENREILLFKISNTNGGQVLIDASIHGNEHATTEALYYVIEWLLTSQEPDAQNILDKNYILVIPIINVDSYGSSRYNARGVDLNRNYETGWGIHNDYPRGSAPLSEPETQAVHNTFLSYDVDWYLNLHTGLLGLTEQEFPKSSSTERYMMIMWR